MVEYNFDEFIEKLEELQADIQEAGKRVTNRAIQEGKREAKDRTPTGEYTDKVFFMTRAGEQVHFITSFTKQGGTLQNGWHHHRAKRVGDGWKGEFYNNEYYGPYVNFGHRLVRNKVTIGYVPGKFFFNAGVAFMENHLQQYWKEEVEKAKRKFEK